MDETCADAAVTAAVEVGAICDTGGFRVITDADDRMGVVIQLLPVRPPTVVVTGGGGLETIRPELLLLVILELVVVAGCDSLR